MLNKSLLIKFLLTFLLVISFSLISWAQTSQPIGTGEVIKPSNITDEFIYIRVRDNSPTVTPFSYSPGQHICTVINGARFKYFEVLNTLNNEIWYKVQFTNADQFSQEPKCQQEQIGWIIGKFRDGRTFVKTTPITEDSDQVIFTNPLPPPLPAPETIPKGQEVNDNESTQRLFNILRFLQKSLLMFFGTFLALIALIFEEEIKNQEHDNDYKKILTRTFYRLFSVTLLVKSVLLMFFILLFILIVVNESYITNSQNEFLKIVGGIINGQDWYEQLVTGIIISLFLLKYISFD